MATTPNKPKTVLVTGAAGGMCAGINRKLSEAGHTVLCADLDPDAARRAAEVIIAAGGSAAAFGLDVASEESVQHLHEEVQARFGTIDGLINAAGILDRKYLADL